MSAVTVPDFRALFEATPSPYLVLATNLHIVFVNNAYLQATRTSYDDIIGRAIFDVFPDNPADPAASGVHNLRVSLLRVLRNKCADIMGIQRYDIRVMTPDGMRFEERHWSPVNTPVFDAHGDVSLIIHRVDDVTEFVRACDRTARTARMATMIDDQALDVDIANRRLREANDELEQRVAARAEAQRQTEEKLRASELRFRTMADSIPQIVWIIDETGHGVYFNRQWSIYTGIPIDNTLPEKITDDFVHPDDRSLTMQAWARAVHDEKIYSVEHRIRSASGQYRWFLVRAEPFRDPQSGAITLWFGTSTDVHDRKLAEAALKKSEARYRSLFDSMDEGFCMIDVMFDEHGRPYDYRFCDLNPSFQSQTGLVDAAGKTMRELAPEHEAHWFDIYGRVAKTGEPVRFENEAKALGRWFDVFASRIEEEDGPKVALLFKDITEQKRMTESLRRSEHAAVEAAYKADTERHKLNALLQAAPVGIVVSDTNGAILLANPAHKHLWGVAHPHTTSIDEFSEWKGWWADHSERHGRRLEPREWTTARILAGVENPRDIVTIESLDRPPVHRTVLITGSPVKDNHGNIVGAVVAQMDISDRIKAEDALRQADRRKDEFLAMLAHELRNPLAPISAAADLLSVGRPDETRIRQISGIITRQVRHMTGLVDDLLDVSRVTRGLVQLEKTTFDAKKILSDAIEQVRPLIERRRHRLALHTPPEAACVYGDIKRLVQVVTNLLNNAAKYTPEGGDIVLAMEVDGDHVKIVVSDNGIGIASELQSSVFDLFTQAARTSDRSQGGLGIGLSLVKSLVELHGGHISVHSHGIEAGTGLPCACLMRTRITPRPTPHVQLRTEEGTAAGKTLTVMIVDDNIDAARMLGMFIEELGHRAVIGHPPPMQVCFTSVRRRHRQTIFG